MNYNTYLYSSVNNKTGMSGIFLLPGLQFVIPGMLFPDAREGPDEITPIFNNQIWQLLNNIICAFFKI